MRDPGGLRHPADDPARADQQRQLPEVPAPGRTQPGAKPINSFFTATRPLYKLFVVLRSGRHY